LGSTGSSLYSGGSSGRSSGESEFALTLQEVARAGALVKKGTTIAEFDRQYMLLRVDDYRASVAQTEAGFKKLTAELEVTKKAHEQTIASAKGSLEKARLDMKTTPVLSAIDAERARLALEEAEARHQQLLAEVKFVEIGQKAEIRNSEIELEQSRIELKRAEANADRMIARAPIDGLVVMQNTFRGTEFAQIQKGDVLYPGQPYISIVDPSSMIINASVNQADIENMRVGARARVRFDAYPSLELPARVYSIGAITRAGGQRPNYLKEVPVILKLEQMDVRVIPDLSVSADVVVEMAEEATVVPRGAVFGDDRGSFVYVRQGDGWERRNIELGVSSNVQSSVRTGLKVGEVVALDAPSAEPSKVAHARDSEGLTEPRPLGSVRRLPASS